MHTRAAVGAQCAEISHAAVEDPAEGPAAGPAFSAGFAPDVLPGSHRRPREDGGAQSGGVVGGALRASATFQSQGPAKGPALSAGEISQSSTELLGRSQVHAGATVYVIGEGSDPQPTNAPFQCWFAARAR